jgi:adenosylcobyric acid synthase
MAAPEAQWDAGAQPVVVAAAAGRDGFVVADDVDVTGRRDAQIDLMADVLTAHLDIDAVVGLLEHGPPNRPTLATALA